MPVTAQVPAIPGDLNDDGYVGLTDQDIILNNWNQYVPPGDERADISGPGGVPDGYVGLDDLDVVLNHWNQGYVPRQPFKGMNLPWVNYWTRQWVFVDVMKISDNWRLAHDAGSTEDLEDLETDVNDWPTALPPSGVTAYIYTGNTGTYPTGRYVCTYDGVGTLEFDLDADVDETATIVGTTTTPGRIEFDVNEADDGIRLTVRSTSASPNHIRNIKIWMPGFENAESPFHPLFIKRLRPFRVIRFMDWQDTNDVVEASWENRKTRLSRTQGNKKGVAVEYMVDLCNELGADPWFCMPHRTDDTESANHNVSDYYVQEFANYVRNNLHSDAKVYVEWSNEVWNALFNVCKWITRAPPDGLVYSVFSDNYFDTWADEAAEDFAIWHDVYEGDESDLVRVLAGQGPNCWVTYNAAERLRTKSADERFDAISCAAYFSGETDNSGVYVDIDGTWDAQAVVDFSINTLIPGDCTDWLEKHGRNAPEPGDPRWRHLTYRYSEPASPMYMGKKIPLLAYEAGQHWTSDGEERSYTQALYAAQDLQEIEGRGVYDAIIANMQAFKQAGGSLYVGFNCVTKQNDLHGSWGHLERQDEPIEDAPKFRALLEFDPDAVPAP